MVAPRSSSRARLGGDVEVHPVLDRQGFGHLVDPDGGAAGVGPESQPSPLSWACHSRPSTCPQNAPSRDPSTASRTRSLNRAMATPARYRAVQEPSARAILVSNTPIGCSRYQNRRSRVPGTSPSGVRRRRFHRRPGSPARIAGLDRRPPIGPRPRQLRRYLLLGRCSGPRLRAAPPLPPAGPAVSWSHHPVLPR